MKDHYRIELFIFPDGTEIEMVVFDRCGAPIRLRSPAGSQRAPQTRRPAQMEAERATPAPSEPPVRLAAGESQRCPLCDGELVYPVDWERLNETTWDLTLRCPDCETLRHVHLDREGVENLNRELYHSARALAHEAETLTRRNFEDEAERIVAALERDLILPMDF